MKKYWILLQIIWLGLSLPKDAPENALTRSMVCMAELLEKLSIVDPAIAKRIATAYVKAFDTTGPVDLQTLGVDSDPEVWLLLHTHEDGFVREAAIARERIRAVSIG